MELPDPDDKTVKFMLRFNMHCKRLVGIRSRSYTYQTSFEVLHPLSGHYLCDEPGKCGGVLPQVEDQEEGLLCDPHFLDTVNNSDEHQMYTAACWHLEVLVSWCGQRLR